MRSFLANVMVVVASLLLASHGNFLPFLWPKFFFQFHDPSPYVLSPLPALRSR